MLAAVLMVPALAFPQAVDTKAAAAAIMQADRDFNQSVAACDKKKFFPCLARSLSSLATVRL